MRHEEGILERLVAALEIEFQLLDTSCPNIVGIVHAPLVFFI